MLGYGRPAHGQRGWSSDAEQKEQREEGWLRSAAMKCCWFVVTLLATRILRSFSAELLFPAEGVPMLNFIMFPLDHFSSLPRSLCTLAPL